MFDSACPIATMRRSVFRRLIRSLPTRSGVIGVATCDKGLPAMMMALAGSHDLPCVLVPGGVTLLAEQAKTRARCIHRRALRARPDYPRRRPPRTLPRLRHARRRMPVPGHRGHLAGGGEALGMSLPHSALSPSGHPIWLDMARRSARAALALEARGLTMRDILTDASVRNAMVVHAAFGGSTNLILHLPAVAHAAGLARPDGGRLDARQSRRSAPGGCAAQRPAVVHPTVQVFLAGGVPEVMLHLRRAGLLDTSVLTVSGETLGRHARLVGAIRTPRGAAPRAAGAGRHRPRRRHHGSRAARARAG